MVVETEAFGKTTGFLFFLGEEKKVVYINIKRIKKSNAKIPKRAYNLTSFFLIPIEFFCSLLRFASFTSIKLYCLNESYLAAINAKSTLVESSGVVSAKIAIGTTRDI